MLELKAVSKIYKTKSQEVHALDKVDLFFEETGLVFITGKSGSGKTTLLNVIGGLDNFSEGEIIIKDKSTRDFTKADYDSYRNTYIGFVFQEYNLLDNMTIEKNISLATQLQGIKDDKERVEKILAEVGLKDVSSRKPQELSGGQRQRVAIARALIKNPSIIMADEPTGALDTENGLQIMQILKKLAKKKLVIVVSHDLELANKFADRIINLKDGKVESDITIKVDEKNKNNVVMKNNVLSIKRGAQLEEKDLKEIKAAVQNGKDVLVTDNINIVKKKTENLKRNTYSKSSNFIRTHLGFWDTIKLGLNTLRSKRFRLVVTIFLCAIAFSIFGIFDAMSIYDEGRLSVNALKASTTQSVTINANVTESSRNSYTINVNDALLETLKNQTGYDIKGVYSSYYFGNSVIPIELNNSNACRISKYYYYKALKGAVEFDEDDLQKYKFSMAAGRLPQEYDEIAVSDYFATCMVNWWYTYKDKDGKTTVLQSVDEIVNTEHPLTLTLGTSGSGKREAYKIVGIVNTGRINKKFDKLRQLENFEDGSTLDKNEFWNYISNGYYLYGFVKPGFANAKVAKFNTMPRYINSAYLFKFTNPSGLITTERSTFYNFVDLNELTKDYFFLDTEKSTLEGNEILIDASQFSTLYTDLIDYLKRAAINDPSHTYETNVNTIIDGLDRMQNQAGKDKLDTLKLVLMNMEEIQNAISPNSTKREFEREYTVKKYDTSKTTDFEVKVQDNVYKIVGFFTGANINATSSLIMSTDGISNLGISLMQGNYSSILATNLGHGREGALGSLLLRDRGVCYTCENSAIRIIRSNSDFFSKLSLLFLIVAGVFAVFSIVMFSNFIATSIRNKYGEIGILRALGARGSDILKMFVVEAVAIALINAVCACVISAVGCIFVNMFLSSYLNLYIPLAAYTIRQVAIIFALSVGVGIVSAILPIWSVSKQKPVETIRKAF